MSEDGDIEEEKCTLENTSKMQLSRLTVESIMTSSVCLRLNQRSQEEINLIEGCLQKTSKSSTSFAPLQATIAESLKVKSDFKEKNSMGSIVKEIYLESEKMVQAVTIRKWCSEFQDYGLFKKNLRGYYERTTLLAQMLYSLTLPVWVSIPLSKATEEALKNCSDALLAGGFQSTDLEATEHNQDPTIKIHEPMPMNFSGHSSLSAFLTSLKSVRNDSPIS